MGVTNRRFRLRAWHDCEPDWTWGGPTNEDQRTIWITVLNTPLLALTNLESSAGIVDSTWADETPGPSNTLYAAEGTNATAQFTLQFVWEPRPAQTNEPGPDRFRYVIERLDGSTTRQWFPTNAGDFATNPVILTWVATNDFNGLTNRAFRITAWYDGDRDNLFDETETHRRVHVTLLKVDLDIANGQGGSLLDEDKEETPGAFTVANLNDTDGDGTTDKDDSDVSATANGRDEIDLMQILLHKPEPDLGDKVKLKVVSGDVKIWEQSKKVSEVTLTGGAIEFNTTDLDKTLWVEARSKSGTLRDIELELEYKGCKDAVKATGLWVERTNFRNTGSSLSADADGAAIQASFAAVGGHLGATNITPKTNNGMEMEMTVYPAGIGSEPGIVFDITRQEQTKAWRIDGTNVTEIIQADLHPDFPSKDEEPNDDAGISDEDNVPNNNHIYSIDFPGAGSDTAFADRLVLRFNFNEFVRVLVNGGAFANTEHVIEGSRSSDKSAWRSRMDVIKDTATGKWKRNTAVSGENEIELGHKAIGGAPTP